MSNDRESGDHTGVHRFSEGGTGGFGELLTVPEAVIYALSFDLQRTEKTIRKWCARGDVKTKKENTNNAFRYLIERESLDIKIKEELEIQKAHMNARANRSERVRQGANRSEPVQTSANTSELMAVLTDQLAIKDGQLAEKDAQISKFLEREKESNILIQQLSTIVQRFQLPSGQLGEGKSENGTEALRPDQDREMPILGNNIDNSNNEEADDDPNHHGVQ